jgi:MerR family transcriptional regulator, thiopeptide resistance regulator
MTTTPPPTDDIATGTSVIPVLVYEDIQAAHDFLVRAFGFTSGGIFRTDDGTVVHAEVRAGDSPIWLHRVTAEHGMASPKGERASHGGLEVIVPDVDVHFAKAEDAGARIERPPTEQDYGLREYGVRDLENHRWWFSSPLTR